MRFRQTRPGDLVTALGFIPESFGYAPALRAKLPALWDELIRKGQLGTGVVENAALPMGRQVVGVGLTSFVENGYIDAELADPRPGLNARLMEAIASGRSPLLDRRRIAEGNAKGDLTLVALHFASPRYDDLDLDALKTLAASLELLRLITAGYSTRRLIIEVADEICARFLESAGMPVLADFSAQAAQRGNGIGTRAERHCLMSIDRAELPIGSAMWMTLLGGTPRFGFSPAEQKVLFSALLHEADSEIAAELCISPDTLSKHWRSIYNRVLAADPLFFPAHDRAEGRGRGKRRRLLRYIEEHMEELRPWAPLRRRTGVRPVRAAEAASLAR